MRSSCRNCGRRARSSSVRRTLTEYANFIAIGMPTGYSSLGGFGFNPYDPRVDPRTTAPFNDGRPVLQTGGSSSGPGIGVNANLARDCDRHRDLGIDPEPRERERHRRHQADRGSGQPRRNHSDHRRSGHGGTPHPHGGRCRDTAGCHRRLRSQRPGNGGVSQSLATASATTRSFSTPRAERRTHCGVLSADSARRPTARRSSTTPWRC